MSTVLNIFIEGKFCSIKILAVVNQIYNFIKTIQLVGQELFVFHRLYCFPLDLSNQILNPSNSLNLHGSDTWLKRLK